jgi:hypothetical protein
LADLDATTSIIGALVNGAAITAQRALLDREEIKKLKDELLGRNYLSQDQQVKQQRQSLVSQLRWIVLFHVINLGIFAAFILFLVIGPVTLSQYFPRIQGSPLTSTAKILLWLWLIISGLNYIALCLVPTFKLWQLTRETKKWLSERESKKRNSSASLDTYDFN